MLVKDETAAWRGTWAVVMPGEHSSRLNTPICPRLLSLLGEGAGEEPDEGDGSSQGCCGPAADAVSEDAHNGRAEENHAHGQGANPR